MIDGRDLDLRVDLDQIYTTKLCVRECFVCV